MIETKSDLWSNPNIDAIAITTNGTIKSNGECVMGRGCALEVKNKHPDFPRILGEALKKYGNMVFVFDQFNPKIITFPVKHNWHEKADIELIKNSCIQLSFISKSLQLKSIIIPRPGCGNGKLDWKDVRPILEKYFDDRFFVCYL